MRQVSRNGKVRPGSSLGWILIASDSALSPFVHGEPPCAVNRASTAAEVFYRRAVMFLFQSFVIRVADGSNADAMCILLWLESRDDMTGWFLGWFASLSNTAAI